MEFKKVMVLKTICLARRMSFVLYESFLFQGWSFEVEKTIFEKEEETKENKCV